MSQVERECVCGCVKFLACVKKGFQELFFFGFLAAYYGNYLVGVGKVRFLLTKHAGTGRPYARVWVCASVHCSDERMGTGYFFFLPCSLSVCPGRCVHCSSNSDKGACRCRMCGDKSYCSFSVCSVPGQRAASVIAG